MKVYRIELRRSPLLAALPVLILVDLAVLFGRSRYWIGVWPEASVATQVVTLFLGPVLAAVSAWQAGRASRAKLPEFLLAAARPSWQVEAARLAATLTMGFFSYVLGAVVAAVVTFPDAGAGFLWPSYFFLGVATLTLFAAAGHLAGRYWPSPAFTPVICALGGFVLLLSIGQGFGIFVIAGAPSETVRPLPVVLRLLLAALLAALAVLAPEPPYKTEKLKSRPLSVRHRGAFFGVASCCLVVLASFPIGGQIQTERKSAEGEILCDRATSTAPEVCVWREHRKYLRELTAMAARLRGVPQSWVRTPATFYEEGLRRTSHGDLGFDIPEGHVRGAAVAMAGQVSSLSFGDCLPPGDADRAWDAVNRIDLWLEYRAMGEDPQTADEGMHVTGVGDAQEAAAHAAQLPENDQRIWVSREREQLRKVGCAA
ncbi:ABC transporter permease [Streptomyces sp. NPDC046197]|uniref:DUF7224 domain-containing protein n=1 Tax=Streptomyces sp. NPDC046197 TaxID=3154337 RepID=UPI0033D2874A